MKNLLWTDNLLIPVLNKNTDSANGNTYVCDNPGNADPISILVVILNSKTSARHAAYVLSIALQFATINNYLLGARECVCAHELQIALYMRKIAKNSSAANIVR